MEDDRRKRRWRDNMRSMKEKVQERLRLRVQFSSQRFLRQSQRQPGVGWKATATGLVVARVFHGNTVLARVARSMAKNEWQKRMGRLVNFLPKFRTLAVPATAGSVAYTESAHLERLSLPNSDYQVGASSGRIYSSRDQYDVSLDVKGRYEGFEERNFQEDSGLLRMMQNIAVPLIGNVSYVFMHGLNCTEVYGAEKLQNAIFHRRNGQALITVSNHVAALDDPFVISSLLPPHKLMNASNLRWTLCATDRCFTSASVSAFFRSVKVLPLTRGLGVYQEGMEVALRKLNRGEWVHIFPEGSRSRDGTLGLVKRGVGRLVLDADVLPLLVPFVHSGMQDVMPIGQKFPSIQKKVTVLVGDPIFVDDLIQKHFEGSLSRAVLYDAIALRVSDTMWLMKRDLEQLIAKNSSKISKEQTVHVIQKAQGLWQYVDWEAQGMIDDFDSCEDRELPLQSLPVASEETRDAVALTSAVFHRPVDEYPGLHIHSWVGTGGSCNLQGGNSITVCLDSIATARDKMHPSVLMGFAARAFATSRPKIENLFPQGAAT